MTTIVSIIAATAAHFDMSVEDLTGPMRTASHCERRAVAYHLCASLTETSLAEIGVAFNRDHSSVARGLERPLSYSACCAIEELRWTVGGRTAHAPAYVKRWPFRSRRKPMVPKFFRRYTACPKPANSPQF